jgi:hypothetical protein
MVERYKGKVKLRVIDTNEFEELETTLGEESAEDKAKRERILAETAMLEDADYESRRSAIAKLLGGWRVVQLDKERDRRRSQSTASKSAAATPPPPTIEELAEVAKDIIAAPNVLKLFEASIGERLAGEIYSAQLVYLCATSRLFAKPMNLAIKGLSAIGKSHLRDRVLDYIPPEDVVAFTTMTEKALIYLPDSLAHKILSMAEALGSRDHELQDYLIREIISEGRITHMIAVPGAPGELPATQRKVIEGPIMFVTTTTRARLHPEIETRILSVETNDTQKQTRLVLRKIAEIEGDPDDGWKPDLAPWHAYQRWLAAGERRVVIPFARELADHPDLDDKRVRMRRDFRQVLGAIQAHALLNRQHRARDDKGRIVASVEEDYAAVFEIMADGLAQGAGTRLKKNDLRVLEALKHLDEGDDKGVRVQTLIGYLDLDQTTINRRLIKLTMLGYAENLTPGKGRTGHFKATGAPDGRDVLPHPDDLLDK